MPLTILNDAPSADIFGQALKVDSFMMPITDAPNLFAQLEPADSSFSASLSGDDEFNSMASFAGVQPKVESSSNSSDDLNVFRVQPSPELIALEESIHRHEPHLFTISDASMTAEHPAHAVVKQEPLDDIAATDDDEDIGSVDNDAEQTARDQKRSPETTVVPKRRAGRPSRAALALAAANAAAKAPPARRGRPGRKPTPAIQAAKAAARAPRAQSLAKINKKRKASSQNVTLTKNEQEMAATLDLSRDELLNMTSESLEAYAQRLAAQRPLTCEEQKRFKRQRRLIKNRESAQLSRLRKKAYVDELEKQISELSDEKERLRRRTETQAREIDSMKAELAYLRTLVPAGRR